MEAAGPREKIFFDPGDTGGGIVTCGGLCPGMNDVIRALVLSLSHTTVSARSTGSASATKGWRPKAGTSRLPSTP